MPMQNHMGAKCGTIIPYLMLGFWHYAWHQFGASCSCLMSGFLHCCCYTSRYQAQTSYVTIRHSIIARAFFVRRMICTRKCERYTKLHLHYTNISWELFFLCVIVLGNKAHKTAWNTHSCVTRQILFGELISVKQARKTHQAWAKSQQNLHNRGPCGDFMAPLKTCWQLAWRAKGKHTETH